MQDLTVDKRKELKERIRIFQKNEKALCDILTFYAQLESKEQETKLIDLMLMDEVIKDLEDEEINIPLRALNIKILLEKNDAQAISIIKVKSQKMKFKRDYRKDYLYQFYYRNYRYSGKFDFLKRLIEKDLTYASEFLTSNISLEKRADMLYWILITLIKENETLNFEGLLSPNVYIRSRTTKEEKAEKMTELKAYFKTWIENKKNILLGNILDSNYPQDWLVLLEQNDLVDFLSETRSARKENNDSSFSYTSVLLRLGTSLSQFKKFYELDAYRQVSEDRRNNDDAQILMNLPIEEISYFISLNNFNLTEEKVKIIGKKVLEYQKEQEESLEALVEQIKNAILNKASTEEEIDKICDYACLFSELANYESYKESLESQREANLFLRRLYNRN